MSQRTSPIRAVVFDAYGTLFDVYAISALAEKLYPGQGAAVSVLWRDKQIEYTRLISLSDPNPQGSRHYQSFWDLTRAALRYALARLGLAHTAANEDALMAQYAQLTAFPENWACCKPCANAAWPRRFCRTATPRCCSPPCTVRA